MTTWKRLEPPVWAPAPSSLSLAQPACREPRGQLVLAWLLVLADHACHPPSTKALLVHLRGDSSPESGSGGGTRTHSVGSSPPPPAASVASPRRHRQG